MTENNIDEQLSDFEKKHENNWQHLIFNLRKHMDVWNTKHVKAPLWHIKQSYLPVLFNIHVHGTTATEIGQRSMGFKQNISRTIKELEDKGIIVARVNKEDKRSERLNLTPEAKKFILATHVKLDQLQEEYEKIVGEEELKIATKVLLKIIAYHENLEKNVEDDAHHTES